MDTYIRLEGRTPVNPVSLGGCSGCGEVRTKRTGKHGFRAGEWTAEPGVESFCAAESHMEDAIADFAEGTLFVSGGTPKLSTELPPHCPVRQRISQTERT